MTEKGPTVSLARKSLVSLVLCCVAAGAAGGAAVVMVTSHFEIGSAGPAPDVIYSLTAQGNNTSESVRNSGTFQVPGAVGRIAVLLVEVRTNVSPALIGGAVNLGLSNGLSVGDLTPQLNGAGVAIDVPTGATEIDFLYGGVPLMKGIPYSVTVSVTDFGLVETSG